MGSIQTKETPEKDFNAAAEGQTGWKIRLGVEPIDLHGMRITGKGFDDWVDSIGIGSGLGGGFAYRYIEVLNPQDEVVKRVHALGQELKDGELQMGAGGRLVGLVVDGKYTTFEGDDPIQQDDPHETKPNQLQHADTGTQTAFEGTERQVMELYGAMVRATIEVNNQDYNFGMLGQSDPNANTFNTEMRENLGQMAEALGIEMDLEYGWQGRWSIGSGDSDMIETSPAVATWASMPDLMAYIDELEQAAAEQWDKIHEHKLDLGNLDLETAIPERPAADPGIKPPG